MKKSFNDLIKIEWASLDEVKPEVFEELRKQRVVSQTRRGYRK